MNAEKILSYPPEQRQAKIQKYAERMHHKGTEPFDALLPELIKYGKHYKPKRTTAAYVAAMTTLGSVFDLQQHRPTANHPFSYCLFTIASQHVYGNSPEECIDNALDQARSKIGSSKHPLRRNRNASGKP